MDIVIELDGEGDIFNIVCSQPGVRIVVVDRFSYPEKGADIYTLPVFGEPGEMEDYTGYRADCTTVDAEYVNTFISAIGE